MDWLPIILPFAVACFVASAALQRRSPLAWYAGWVFLFLAAGAVCLLGYSYLFHAESGPQMLGPGVFLVGGLVFWVGGASLWATYRPAFFPVRPPPAPAPAPAPTPAPSSPPTA